MVQGINTPYAQYDLLHRAAAHGVHIIAAQETYFTDTYTIPLGQWLLISSGVLNNQEFIADSNINKQLTGVAIYLKPELKDSLITYLTVTDRIMTASILTKNGPLTITNHHAPDESKPLNDKTAHWDLLSNVVYQIPNDHIN